MGRKNRDLPVCMAPLVVKVVLAGESGVGKSSLFRRLLGEELDAEQKSTIAADFRTKKISEGDSSFTLQLWDTSGQEKFKALSPIYYRGAHGVLFVYDVTDRHSFEALESLMAEVTLICPKALKWIVGNKSDQTQNVSITEGQRFADSKKIPFVCCSALDQSNIQTLEDQLLQSLIEYQQSITELHVTRGISFEPEQLQGIEPMPLNPRCSC